MSRFFSKYLTRLICVMLSLFLVASSFPIFAYAKDSYISEITIASGSNAIANLEEDGYNVLFQGMNVVTDDSDSMVYIGYKMGSTPITNLLISTEKSNTISSSGVSYSLVSSTNLNSGTSGTSIYLYSTKDSSAGGGITSLDTSSGFTDDGVVSLKNDGSSPVRMSNGDLANLDYGISGNEIYLLMYRQKSVMQYISNAYVVSGSSKASVINSAADKGCNCYLDYNLSSGDTVTYIAYERTNDKSKAINGLILENGELNIKKDDSSNSYLLDLSSEKLFASDFTLGSWASIYSSTNRSISKSSDEYNALVNSEENCSCVLASSSGNVYALYLGTPTDSVDAKDEEQEETTVEEVTDEFLGIDKEETTVADDDNSSTASVFNKTSIVVIIVFAIILLVVIVALIIYKKKGRKKNEEEKQID